MKFFCRRALKQGDLLSPLLFIIVAKGLNIMIKKAEIEGFITGLPG